MPAINSDTVDFWRQLAKDLEPQRPSPGKQVKVTGGRKHKGKSGIVLRHMRSHFKDYLWQYGSEANLHMRDLRGREGFVILVHPNDGPDFWVDADKVEVISNDGK